MFPLSSSVHNNEQATHEHNKQFHKKGKPLPARITLQHAQEHLLSPSKCSKRYLCAYCLNLHQLTTPSKFLLAVVEKCTPIVSQLRTLLLEDDDDNKRDCDRERRRASSNASNASNTSNVSQVSHCSHASSESSSSCSPKTPSISSLMATTTQPTQTPLNLGMGVAAAAAGVCSSFTPMTSPNPSPVHSASSATGAVVGGLHSLQLNVIPDHTHEQAVEEKEKAKPRMKQPVSRSHPQMGLAPAAAVSDVASLHHLVEPMRSLECCETRSCPETDDAYHQVSSECPDTSSPLPSQEEQDHEEEEKKCTPSSIAITTTTALLSTRSRKTKMKAYCVATLKHNLDVLYHWVFYYPQDLAQSPLLDELLSFVQLVSARLSHTHASIDRRRRRLSQLIEQQRPAMKHASMLSSSISNLRASPKIREHGRKTSFQFTDSFFPPREMVHKLGGGMDLLKIHPALIADQLTLIDAQIFLQIEPRELTNQSWASTGASSASAVAQLWLNSDLTDRGVYASLSGHSIEAPNLLYMIDHVNRLSLWVATEILSRSTTAEMADLTKYFYVVAHRCLELCNIHTCTAIFGGICLQPLTRLRRLQRYLCDDEQIQTLHRTLSEMVSTDHNYKTYRTFMEQWLFENEQQRRRLPRPCMPFFPVVMKDLYQIQLNLVPRVDREKYVDLGLLEKNCRQIRRLYECQHKAKLYAQQLPTDTDIQSQLRMNITKFETHDTLREWSFDIQPKLTKEDRENLEMIDTLEEFGFL